MKDVRLQLARELLENRECETILKVSQKVDFSSRSYFSKNYKAKFEKLPSEYFE